MLFRSLLFERLGGMQDGVMLDGGGDQVPALGGIGLHDALEGPVIAFGAARGEVDFAAFGADDRRELLAGLFHGGGSAGGMTPMIRP